MPDPGRIEMILPSLEVGGMERMVCQLSLGLVARGWDVGVTCTTVQGDLAGPLREAGVGVSLIPLEGWRSWVGLPALQQHLRLRRPTIVHTHSGVWLRAMVAAWRAGVPGRLHTVHGVFQDEPWFGPIEKHLASRLTHRVVAVSPSLKLYLHRAARLQNGRVSVVPNGVNTDQYHPGGTGLLKARLGIGPSGRLIGIVARLDPIKNIALVFPVLAALVARGLDVHFVIAGDGPDRQRLEHAATASGVRERVHFLGVVEHTQAIYPELDVFVLPSHLEGTSLSLLEALACGIPCVATRVGGNPAVLAEGEAGVLIGDNDGEALLDAVAQLLTNEHQWHSLAMSSRARALTEYSLAAMIERYEAEYRLLPRWRP